MSYSCADFTDAILEALDIRLETDEERNDPETQAGYAVAEIDRLQKVEIAYIKTKGALVDLIAELQSESVGGGTRSVADHIVVDLDLQSDIDALIKF